MNSLVISRNSGKLVFTDSVAGVTAGAGCTQASSTVARCTASSLLVHLGGENDTATIDSSVPTTGTRTIYGDEDDDSITGGAGADTLYAGPDNDGDTANMNYLYGGGGNDTLWGDTVALTGRTTMDGAGGGDTFRASTGVDTIDYSNRTASVSVTVDSLANDGESGEGDKVLGLSTLKLGSGDDTFNGGSSPEYVYGGAGSDELNGGAGSNQLYGEFGDDYLYGGTSADSLYGGAGFDELSGGAGTDYLEGGDQDDYLYGGANSDSLWGNAGGDVISGEDGDDSITGGSGVDWTYGDAGNDSMFLFDSFADLGDCGDGADSADVDGAGLDTVFGNCETVTSH
ncbi:MAG: hypothetical protein HY827_02040 [Actinobacteria bacterium]|nr:hypothetical protein [Actinomycetota bacterium]